MMVEQKRVLVVDDDASVREMLGAALRKHDLTVDTASTCADAADLLRDHQYSVVLLDPIMPGLDGLTILERLGAAETTFPPVVLVITGADRAAIAQLDARRIHGIVRKPADPEEIARLVVACAEIRSRSSFGTMAVATMIACSPFLALLIRLP